MKRSISFGIAVLMILATCLLVSCNSEVSTAAQANDGKLVYATFDKMSKAIRPSSSSMTISYELDNINNLYWVYTATKTDGAGTTGQTTGTRVPGDTTTHKGLGGAIGPFSKGTWTFTVEGYKYTGTSTDIMDPSVETLRGDTNFNLIYVGTADGVVLNTTNTSTNPETINITVYLQTQGGTGTLKIAANSKFFWAATGEGGSALTDLKLKVYDGNNATAIKTITLSGHASAPSVQGDAVYYSNDSDTNIINLTSGDHVFKVQVVRTVNNADQVFFEGTVNAKIYAGITTALDTQAIEGLFTYAQFNGTIDDSAVVVVATDTKTTTTAGSVSFETNYTPASGINPSTNKTTVSISGATSIITTDASYKLGVETSNIIAAGSKFSVASNSTAVASVDLTLTKTKDATTSIVSEFGNNGAATVTTYIAKNLSGVKFFYENAEFTKVTSVDDLAVNKFYYEESSGKLVFMTNHFSEFYVTSTDKVYDNQANTCYTLGNFNALDVTNIADHEFLLLDAAVANDVDDSRDVFNAGFKWAVIHTPSDLPNTTDFAGGYGTKIEPLLIANVGQLQKVTDYYSEYNYYKIKDKNAEFNCSNWTPLKLNGSFDGNGVSFVNIDNFLFRYIGQLGDSNEESWSTKDVVVKNYDATFDFVVNLDSAAGMCRQINGRNTTTFKNVKVHGRIIGGSNSGTFLSYSSGNALSTAPSFSFNQVISLIDCQVDATLITTSGSIGIVGGYETYFNPGIKITVSNSSGSLWNSTTSKSSSGKAYLIASIAATSLSSDSTTNTEYTVPVLGKEEITMNESDYYINVTDNATSAIVYIGAQLDATDNNDAVIAGQNGITMGLGTINSSLTLVGESVKVLDSINSLSFVNKQSAHSASYSNGVLSVTVGGSDNYTQGTIKLIVVEFDSSNNVVSYATKVIYEATSPNQWVKK